MSTSENACPVRTCTEDEKGYRDDSSVMRVVGGRCVTHGGGSDGGGSGFVVLARCNGAC
ncbi:hypothetical protein Dimus_035949, partial [Dionaea muscipula]